MDLKLFLLVGVCCVLRVSAEYKSKAMQAERTGQLRRLNPRFGRNFVLPPLTDENNAIQDAENREEHMNEILNTIPGEADEMEPGMADGTWRLPLENQLFKYFNRPRRY
ncbi:uncharacterized protein [Asterias amurensis]|uniref:uncharacterized protein n=1 Tax=Asterias amurensis TaxID=7602 RepID=UPI003AB895F0